MLFNLKQPPIQYHNQHAASQNIQYPNEKRMKIVKSIKIHSRHPSLTSQRKQINTAYNNNKQSIVKLMLSKIQTSRGVRRCNSIPYINKSQGVSQDNGEQNINIKTIENVNNYNNQTLKANKAQNYYSHRQSNHLYQQTNQQQYKLSPRKSIKTVYTTSPIPTIPQIKTNNINNIQYKQKVVIFSSSNINNDFDLNINPIKSKSRIKLSIKTQRSKHQKIPHINMQQLIKLKHTKKQEQNTTKNTILKNKKLVKQNRYNIIQQLIDRLDEQVQCVDLQSYLKTDLQILKLYPAIDLQLLVSKIKKQQKYRKQQSIDKWKHFDYRNLSS